jgi:tetratricopeptide (TPR) repeat protein
MNDTAFLLIDPEIHALTEIEQILESLDYIDIQTTESANDAWSLMKIKAFSCIVSAWDMPEMNGLSLLRVVRRDDSFHDIPFYLADSAFTQLKVLSAGQAGVTGLIVKPFQKSVIEEKFQAQAQLVAQPDMVDASQRLEAGIQLIESNNFQGALEILEDLTQQQKSAEVYYNIGYIKTARKEFEGAIAAFQKATRLDRLFAKAYDGMGKAYKAMGDKEEAQKCFHRAADIYLGKEKIQDAEEILNEILQINPDSVNVFNSLGVLYRKKGDLKTALYQYRKALKVHPDTPHIHYNIGRLYFDMKRFAEAKTCFQRALAVDPEFQEAKQVLDAMKLGNM